MKRIIGYGASACLALAALGFNACDNQAGDTTAPRAGGAVQPAANGEAPQVTTMLDRATGRTYILNPNRREIGAGGALAKAAGAIGSEFTDASGKVHTKIWECSTDNLYGQQAEIWNAIGCQVDAQYAAVGGGAHTEYGSGAGALLTESRPWTEGGNKDFWLASSKDHGIANYHTLKIYVIGMRIDGISVSTLKANLHITTSRTSVSELNNGLVSPPSGDVIVGGGARVNWTGAGNLLTSTFPGAGTNHVPVVWGTSSKDHVYYDAASLDSYVLSFPPTLPGVSGTLTSLINYSTINITTHVQSVNASIPSGYAPACAAAQSTYESGGWGRLLYGAGPEPSGSGVVWVARSKDHLQSDVQGTLSAGVVGVRIQ